MNETMNDDKSRICETKPTGENALKSPPVGPIPKNTENESDKPSPEDEATDLHMRWIRNRQCQRRIRDCAVRCSRIGRRPSRILPRKGAAGIRSRGG